MIKLKSSIFIFLIFSINLHAKSRSEKIRSYIESVAKGKYSPENIAIIKKAAEKHNVSAAEIDAAMGFNKGVTQEAFSNLKETTQNKKHKKINKPTPYSKVSKASRKKETPVRTAPTAPKILDNSSNNITAKSNISPSVRIRREKIRSYIENIANGNYTPENIATIKKAAEKHNVSAEEIDAAMGFSKGVTQKAFSNLKATTQLPKNQYTIPKINGFTEDQVSQLAEKYKNEFGRLPSPEALKLFSYRTSGTYPQTFESILDSIEKKPIEEDTRIDLRLALDGGIDPNIYMGTSGKELSAINMVAVLNSDNPNMAFRMAKRQLLNNKDADPNRTLLPDKTNHEIVAQSGNFAVRRGYRGHLDVILLDNAGNSVKSGIALNSAGLLSVAYMYGLTFDDSFKNSLIGIADQLDSKNIKYAPGERIQNGMASDAGVNLRDLANGGIGSPSNPGDMRAAHWQSNVNKKFFGAKDDDFVVTQPILRAANNNYIFDTLGVNTSFLSSVSTRITPQHAADGTRNYVVIKGSHRNNNFSASWYATKENAEEFTKINGGKVYDLNEGLPNYLEDKKEYHKALMMKYPSLQYSLNTINQNNIGTFSKPLPSIKSKSFILSPGLAKQASSTLRLTSPSGKKSIRKRTPSSNITKNNYTLSDPKSCQFHLLNDLRPDFSSLKESSGIPKDQLKKMESSLRSSCIKGKGSTSVGPTKLLSKYFGTLTTLRKKLIIKEINNNEKLKKHIVTNSFRSSNKAKIPEEIKEDSYFKNKVKKTMMYSHISKQYKNYSQKINPSFKTNTPHVQSYLKRSISSEKTALINPPENKHEENDEFKKIVKLSKERQFQKNLLPQKSDSLFTILSKAYLRNYDKLE